MTIICYDKSPVVVVETRSRQTLNGLVDFFDARAVGTLTVLTNL